MPAAAGRAALLGAGVEPAASWGEHPICEKHCLHVNHDLSTVQRSLRLLEEAGAPCWLFGGWAEQLRGLCAPRRHADVDLLYPAEDFATVERMLGESGLEEIEGKRFPHKRAFLFEGVMVELFLVQRDTHGLFTSFWGRNRHDWPPDTLGSTAALPVASAAALTGYRSRHQAVSAQYALT